jgi:flagellar hook-basal body complex protein FliE
MSISPVDLFPTDVSGIGGLQGVTGAGPAAPTTAVAATDAPDPAHGAEFGHLLLDGIDRVEGLTDRADHLAVQAATGDLSNIHDYTIAASEAQVATQLTVAVRNQALSAFNEILRMQV